jgi:SAM-dependent methyltransferase
MQSELVTVMSRRRGYQDALDDVWLRMAQLDLFLTEARRAFPNPPEPAELVSIPTGFDSLYATFQEAFRGPESIVRERLRGYVADIAAACQGAPVCDLGCGRGELVSLLGEAGVSAYGVDHNPTFAERAAGKGLDIRVEDVRSHLRSLDPGTLGAVSAIQLVSHLEIDELIELIELCARAVRPDGALVFESQNPENLTIGSNAAYLDPSIRRPLSPQLLAFLVESRGFSQVEIRRISSNQSEQALARPKPDDPWAEEVGPVVDALNLYLFGPTDYAVIARRP